MLAALAALHLIALTQVDGPSTGRQLSLLSAEPLEGGSMATAWAGWSSFGAQWGMGVTARDDLGLSFDFDWAGTELRVGGWYRRPVGLAGPFDVAGRLGVGYYASYGAHFIHEGNHDDEGVSIEPALVLSSPGAGGIFSAAGEVPIVVTTRYDGGLLFTPRLSLSYETPVYPDLSVGVLGSIGYRAGTDEAPMRDGRADVRFLLLVGYQIL